MATVELSGPIFVDPEVQAAVDRMLRRIRDPDAMRRAADRMDRMREEMRRRVGVGDLAVWLIRSTRADQEWCADQADGMRRMRHVSS
jgi:hypothetical protein